MTSVPTPKTWITNEDLTSADVNARITAVLTFLLNRPMVRLRQTATQTLTTGTFTTITFTTEDLDDNPDGSTSHSTSVNTGRFTAVYAGWHTFRGAVTFAADTSGVRDSRWTKNGAAVSASAAGTLPLTGGATTGLKARTLGIFLDVADYVELQAYHSKGSNLDTVSSSEQASSMEGLWERLAA